MVALLRLTAALLAGFGALFLAACEPSAPPQNNHGAGAALWRIELGQAQLYAFGSIHALPEGVDWMRPNIVKALASADIVYFETDIRPETTPKIQQLARALGSAETASGLFALLEPEDQAHLTALAADLNLERAQLDGLKPWLANAVLSASWLSKLGFSPERGADRAIETRARARAPRPEIRYLETPEQQVRLLASLSRQGEIALLSQTLRQIRERPHDLVSLHQTWAAGDVDALAGRFDGDLKAKAPEAYQKLNLDRNRAWAQTLKADLQKLDRKTTLFVCVGAAHLIGEGNLLTLLQPDPSLIQRL